MRALNTRIAAAEAYPPAIKPAGEAQGSAFAYFRWIPGF